MANHIAVFIRVVPQHATVVKRNLHEVFNAFNDKFLRDYSLKQIVKNSTRAKVTKDKSHANIAGLLAKSINIPNIESAGLCAIAMFSAVNKPGITRRQTNVTVRSNNKSKSRKN